MLIASALGTPTAALFGPSDDIERGLGERPSEACEKPLLAVRADRTAAAR